MTCATPLSWDRTGIDIEVIWVRCEGKYFCKRGWTSHFGKHEVICPSGKSQSIATRQSKSAFLPIADIAERRCHVRFVQPAQPVDATHALNLSAAASNCKVSRGRSLS